MILPTEPICVVIGRTRHRMVQAEIQEAAKQGARLIEVRLDYIAKAPEFNRLLENKPCPLMATVRRPVDGGTWKGTEEARLALLRQAIVAGFDWVDLETDVIDSIRRFRAVKRIVSYHNMREMPVDLEKIHSQMCKQDADIVKIAVRAQNPRDNLRVLKLLKAPLKPTIAFCIGDLGFPSRILGAKFGAPFAYCAFNKERTLAPGLPSYQDLKQTYRYPSINADTLIFGVIGDPVAHSLSPLIHNQAFANLGINAVYLPFRVPRNELQNFLKAFESLQVRGYSVTIPHKEEAASLARHKDQAVTRVEAANTLIHGKDGYHAYNTDFIGFLDSLKAQMGPIGTNPTGLTGFTTQPTERIAVVPRLDSRVALVLGAGGVARAVVHALVNEGALVTIANRTVERARNLAEQARCRFVEWSARHSVLADVVVNCTSVGMHPELDVSPLHPSYYRQGLVVYDTVYTPEQTLLVKEARQRGCEVITGVDLFIRQAALQVQLFTGRAAPMDLLRQVVKRALSPVVIHTPTEPPPVQAGG
jgi:3-dehydroquinate dehydratase / shikimate dehydrogenase